MRGRDVRALKRHDVAPAPAVKRGTVKWFDGAKGYGFLVDGTGNDLFFRVAR